MLVPVKDLTGTDVDEIDLSEAVFGVPMRPGVVHQALVRQRANIRQGTVSTKTRSQVSGGGRKPWQQKHTGRARTGSRRSPLFTHGGVTFGPHPRDYSQAMPRKMRRLAIRCMLSDKRGTDALVVLQNLELAAGKTQEMVQLLSALDILGSTLVVTREPDEKVIRSAQNLPRVKTLPASLLNVGDLLQYQYLIMTTDAVQRAEELWARGVIDRHRFPPVEEPLKRKRATRKRES